MNKIIGEVVFTLKTILTQLGILKRINVKGHGSRKKGARDH